MSNQNLDIPNIVPNDWKRLDQIVRKIKLKLGRQSSPTFTGLTITDLTASSLVGTNVSKALESVTIGTGLDYTRPTLSLSHLGIEDLTDPGGDRILFWDDSETACKWLSVGNSITITTTTIDTIQDIRTTASPTFVDLTLSAPSNIYALSHDSFADFVADEHIDHTSVTLTAGTGLTGGGDISSNRTFAVDGVLEDLDTLGANSADSEFLVGTGVGALAWESGATARTSMGVGTGDSPTFAGLSLGTGELTCGSINRAADTLTLEIGGTAEISITSTTITLGGNLIIPDGGTIGSASDTDVMTIDASGNTTFSVFPITPSAAPDADYEVANKKYVDDNAGGGSGHSYVDRGDPAAHDFTLANFTTNGSWHDLDLSSIVPDGAVAVVIYFDCKDNAAAKYFMFRENGNSNDCNRGAITTQVANVGINAEFIITLDANRVIEYAASNTTWSTANFTVKGWFI